MFIFFVEELARLTCLIYVMQQPDIKYVDLGDGRKLCSDCYSITIMDPKECEAHVFENVRRFYTTLNLNVDDIPIALVDKDEMRRVREKNSEVSRFGKKKKRRESTYVS